MSSFLILWLGVFPMVALSQRQDQRPPTFVDENINVTAAGNINITEAVGTSGNITTASNSTSTIVGNDAENVTSVNASVPTPATPSTSNNNNSPVVAPSAAPPIATATTLPVIGIVNLEYITTNRLLGRDTLTTFLTTTEEFLGRRLFSTDVTNRTDDGDVAAEELVGATVPIMADPGLSLTLIRQSWSILRRRRRRNLQSQQNGQQTGSPLYITLEVSGLSTRPVKANEMNQLLQRAFIEHGNEYVTVLRQASQDANDNFFFPSLTQVNVLLDSTLGGDTMVGDEDDEGVLDNVGKDAPTTSPAVAPTKDSTANDIDNNEPTLIFVNNGNGEDTDVETDVIPMSQTAIIAIAVGGGVALLLLMCCCLYFCGFSMCCCKRGGRDNGAATAVEPAKLPQEDSLADRDLLQTGSSSSVTNKNEPDSESASEMTHDPDDLESQAMYSYNPRGDSASVYTFNQNTVITGTQSTMGNDNMSYAYSLEPGIDHSVVGGFVPSNVHTTSMYDNASLTASMYGTDDDNSQMSGIPILEIPNISVTDNSRQGSGQRSPRNSSNTPVDNVSTTQIETTPSDLQLTPSEIAMLPSNLRSDLDDEDDNTYNNDQRSNTASTANDGEYVTRKVTAPSGKLGIVIDTTVNGPVIHKVNENSRLLNKLFPGDNIIAIDDVNTRAMSAAAITSLMVKTAGKERILTVRCKKASP
jgi:hypothetical protein